MLKKQKRPGGRILGVIILCAALVLCIRERGVIFPAMSRMIHGVGIFSAYTVLPEGGAEAIRGHIEDYENTQTTIPTVKVPDTSSSVSSSSSSKSSSAKSSSAASSYVAPPKGSETKKVITKFYSKSSANLIYKNIYVSNKTSTKVDLAKELATRPNVNIKKNDDPMVLIVHTHATESYEANDYGYYIVGSQTRTTNENKNVTRVGAEIAKQLNNAGIKTLHDKTLHDYPSYNGGYDRSAVTIKNYLKKYPSIQVVLDIHRDAITYDSGEKVKPTAEINKKKAAQIMICAGCQDGKVTQYPNWRQNFRFALRIQQQCETDYSGLARPMYFISKRYNEYLLPGSLLIEMGSEANTLEEAIYSGELLGKSLVKVLGTLVKE